MLGLINTRPAVRGAAITQFLNTHKVPVINWPLLAITPLAINALSKPQLANHSTLVVVTSPAAAEYGLAAAQQLAINVSTVQWLCVGSATASVISKAGYQARTAPTANSEGVMAALIQATPAEVWLWRGLGGRELISDAVRAHPALAVCDWRLYARSLPSDCAQQCQQLAIAAKVHSHAVLISSVQTWQHFIEQMGDVAYQFNLIVLGPRVKQTIDQASPHALSILQVNDLQPSSILAALQALSIQSHNM